MVFPSDEAILEAMSGRDNICECIHHRSYFLPELSRIENPQFDMRLAEDVGPINVSTKPKVVENVHIDANSSLEEVAIYTALLKEFHDACAWSCILGIYPHIIEHGI